MLGGWKVEGVSELSDLILQSAAGAGIVSDRLRGRSVELEVQQSLNLKFKLRLKFKLKFKLKFTFAFMFELVDVQVA